MYVSYLSYVVFIGRGTSRGVRNRINYNDLSYVHKSSIIYQPLVGQTRHVSHDIALIICKHMRTHTYTHVYTRTLMYTHVYSHVHTHTHTYIYVHTTDSTVNTRTYFGLIRAYTYTPRTHTDTHVYSHLHTRTYYGLTRTHTCTHGYSHVHIRTHTYIHTYIHGYSHVHACVHAYTRVYRRTKTFTSRYV